MTCLFCSKNASEQCFFNILLPKYTRRMTKYKNCFMLLQNKAAATKFLHSLFQAIIIVSFSKKLTEPKRTHPLKQFFIVPLIFLYLVEPYLCDLINHLCMSGGAAHEIHHPAAAADWTNGWAWATQPARKGAVGWQMEEPQFAGEEKGLCGCCGDHRLAACGAVADAELWWSLKDRSVPSKNGTSITANARIVQSVVSQYAFEPC